MKQTKCPFSSRLDCESCRLYRKGIRLVGIEQRQEEYGNCVFHLMADNLEEVHRKVFSLQKEMGETKNANIFQALAVLTNQAQAKEELKKVVVNHFKTEKLLE
jgi:predicted small metal-binding protein